MKKVLFVFGIGLCAMGAMAQTSTADGSWQNDANWDATYPGSGTDADGTLDLNGETLNFDSYITLGSSTSRVNVNVANSNFAGDFIVNDTLVIFGDVYFDNKSMELTVTSNGVLIVFGNLSMNNKISVASDGLIVVTETFTMSGSTGNNDYSGSGNVYAGNYAGNAESEIDNSGDGTGDSSFTLDQLSDDGFGTIEDFVAGGGAIPLPVEMLFFKSEVSGHVKLFWATTTEINNDRFEVERSEDGQFFYQIGAVDGNGTESQRIDYYYADFAAVSNVAYYRLKQVDFDGKYEYSDVIRVETGNESSRAEFNVYPTVVTNSSLNIVADKSFEVQRLEIYGLSGGQQGQSIQYQRASSNEISLGVNVPNGIYLVKMLTTEGESLVQRIVVK